MMAFPVWVRANAARLWAVLLGLALLGSLAGCAQRGTPLAPLPADVWLDHATNELPAKVSEIGLYLDPVQEIVSPRVIPYTVRYPLYSDDNDKRRYLFLPPGSKIDNRDPAQWRFPEGTLFFKTFYLTALGNQTVPVRKVETRVLQRRPEGWQVAVYQWNSEGSEAYRTDGNEARFAFTLPGGRYTYTIPGRFSCLSCHQPQPDFVIGFEAVQLTGVSGVVQPDQLAELEARDIFLDPARLAPVEIPGPEAERAALGYLHGNCSNCHNPTSPLYFSVDLDLRYGRARATTLNVMPQKFTTGDSSLLRIKPGRPESSLVYQLMARTYADTAKYMPPLGTSLVDSAGLALVRRWILSL